MVTVPHKEQDQAVVVVSPQTVQAPGAVVPSVQGTQVVTEVPLVQVWQLPDVVPSEQTLQGDKDELPSVQQYAELVLPPPQDWHTPAVVVPSTQLTHIQALLEPSVQSSQPGKPAVVESVQASQA